MILLRQSSKIVKIARRKEYYQKATVSSCSPYMSVSFCVCLFPSLPLTPPLPHHLLNELFILSTEILIFNCESFVVFVQSLEIFVENLVLYQQLLPLLRYFVILLLQLFESCGGVVQLLLQVGSY